MLKQATNLKYVMEDLIATEIRRLVAQADVYVFALYDPRNPDRGPVDYRCYQRENGGESIKIDVQFDFEGIGVWYICRRHGDTFTVRHIMVHIRNGLFHSGKVANFEGYWDEFPRFVTEDRWVRTFCHAELANDP
jgi:hypothetical protein